MDIVQLIKIAMAALTALIGVVGALRPDIAARFVGLGDKLSPRGAAEIRAVMGGLFIGLGVAPIVLNRNAAYVMLGMGYLAVGIVRTLSILIWDKDKSPSNTLSLVWEAVFGLALVLLTSPAIPA